MCGWRFVRGIQDSSNKRSRFQKEGSDELPCKVIGNVLQQTGFYKLVTVIQDLNNRLSHLKIK